MKEITLPEMGLSPPFREKRPTRPSFCWRRRCEESDAALRYGSRAPLSRRATSHSCKNEVPPRCLTFAQRQTRLRNGRLPAADRQTLATRGRPSTETNDQFIAFRSTRRSSPAGRGCDLNYRTRLRPVVKGLATMCLWKQNLHIDDFLVRS